MRAAVRHGLVRLVRWPLFRPPSTASPMRRVDSATDVLLRQRVRTGLPLVVVCAWLAKPTPDALAVGAVIALLGMLLRGLAASHLPKHAALATSGPYAL